MPDDELLARAAAGDLHRPEVLLAQTRRMLRDDRARGLATEFGGNWLDFRRFEEHNSVDRERFPAFNDELRQAMFEEPIRFFLDVVREDRSVLDFLYAEHTFVNPVLARHYGMPELEGPAGRVGARRRRPPLRPRRPAADGGVPDQERARACGPARSSAATGSSAGCSAKPSRRRRPRCPSCPTTRPSSAS